MQLFLQFVNRKAANPTENGVLYKCPVKFGDGLAKIIIVLGCFAEKPGKRKPAPDAEPVDDPQYSFSPIQNVMLSLSSR